MTRGAYLAHLGSREIELPTPWRLQLQRPRLQIWTIGEAAPPVQALGPDAALVGETFVRKDRGTAYYHLHDGAPKAVSERLLERRWGAYVALFSQGAELQLFRDPSGGLECVFWRQGPSCFVTSAELSDIPPHLQPKVSLHWPSLAAMLASPVAVGAGLAFEGVDAVAPGELVTSSPNQLQRVQLWRPSDFADQARLSDGLAGQELVQRVKDVVEVYAALGRPALAEVSGGLDSAIVASILAAAPSQDVRLWLNLHASTPRGDERRFARQVASAAGFALTELEKDPRPLDEHAWSALAGSWRPPFAGLDARRDETLASLCQAAGLSQIITGQGGDIVFYQEPTARLLADVFRSFKLHKVGPIAHRLAGWTGRSAWDLIWRALRLCIGRPPLSHPPSILSRDFNLQTRHPWLEAGAEVSAAKEVQIFGLAALLSLKTPSLRTKIATVIDPLIAQPVVELALSLPALQLTEGARRDRAMARTAFCGLAPRPVLERRGKGELSRFYGELVARSLGYLRPLLLDGVLARAGVLERRSLETVLTPEHLILQGDYAALMQAAMLETWARAWAARTSHPAVS